MKSGGENSVNEQRCWGIDEAAVAPYSHLLMDNLFFGKQVPDCDA